MIDNWADTSLYILQLLKSSMIELSKEGLVAGATYYLVVYLWTSGFSFKHFTLVNYNSRVIIYERKMFIRLATDCRRKKIQRGFRQNYIVVSGQILSKTSKHLVTLEVGAQ